MCLLMAAIVGAQAADYDIWVCGVRVTDNNKANIGAAISSSQGTVTGSVSYNSSTKTLTIKNANITTSKDHGIRIKMSGVTVKFEGANYITSTASEKRAIRLDASNLICYLQGDDMNSSSATLQGTTSGIYIDDNCTLYVEKMYLSSVGTKWGICGHDGSHGEELSFSTSSGNVIIDAKAKNSTGEGIGDVASINLQGSYAFSLPQAGTLDASKHSVVDFDGNIAQEVRIKKEIEYGFAFGGLNVTDCNYEVLGKWLKKKGHITSDESSVTYNPSTKTLLLNNMSFSSMNNFIYNFNLDGLIVYPMGNNTVNILDADREESIWSKRSLTIAGSSTSGNHTSHKLSLNKPLLIRDNGHTQKHLLIKMVELDITSDNNYDRGAYVNYPMMGDATTSCEIVSSKVTASYIGSQPNIAAISGFDGGVVLKQCDVKTPFVCYRPNLNAFGTYSQLVKKVEIDVPKTTYNVYVLGHQITDVNPYNFGVDGLLGLVSWEQDTKTLTLGGGPEDSDCILTSTEDNVNGIRILEPNAKIVLKNKNVITTRWAALMVEADGVEITTTGTQTQESRFTSTYYPAILSAAGAHKLTVNADKPVYFEGGYAYDDSNGNGLLTIKRKGSNTKVFLKGSNSIIAGNVSIGNDLDFWYDGTDSTTPGCYLSDHNKRGNYDVDIYQNGGEKVLNKWAALVPVTQRFGLYIGETQVNNANCNAVGSKSISAGNVGYNSANKTLTFNGAIIDDAVSNNNIAGLTVNVAQNSIINNTLTLHSNTTMKGDGILHLTSDINAPAAKNVTLSVNLTTPGSQIIVDGNVSGFSSLNLLNGTQIIKPAGGHYDTSLRTVVNLAGYPTDVGVVFADRSEQTAIETIQTDNAPQVNSIYDLQGRKLMNSTTKELKNSKTQELENLPKGIYIINGQKVMAK